MNFNLLCEAMTDCEAAAVPSGVTVIAAGASEGMRRLAEML